MTANVTRSFSNMVFFGPEDPPPLDFSPCRLRQKRKNMASATGWRRQGPPDKTAAAAAATTGRRRAAVDAGALCRRGAMSRDADNINAGERTDAVVIYRPAGNLCSSNVRYIIGTICHWLFAGDWFTRRLQLRDSTRFRFLLDISKQTHRVDRTSRLAFYCYRCYPEQKYGGRAIVKTFVFVPDAVLSRIQKWFHFVNWIAFCKSSVSAFFCQPIEGDRHWRLFKWNSQKTRFFLPRSYIVLSTDTFLLIALSIGGLRIFAFVNWSLMIIFIHQRKR